LLNVLLQLANKNGIKKNSNRYFSGRPAGVPAHLQLKFTDKYLTEREERFEEKL
jgi:hypothetical protein